jgi:uncharacterized membrane protein
MIDWWLNLPEAGIFGVLALVYGASALLLALQPTLMPWRRTVLSFTGVVAPYFTAVALMFGLSFGFLAAEVAQRNRLAWQAVVSEGNALATVRALAGENPVLAGAARDYAAAAIGEWPAMGHGRADPAAAGALAHLLSTAAEPTIGGQRGSAVQAAVLTAASGRVAAARGDRLAIAADHTHSLKWLGVLLLGVLTQVGLLLVHLDKPRAMVAALFVFSVAMVVALGLVAAQELPFSGAIQVPSALLAPAAGAD